MSRFSKLAVGTLISLALLVASGPAVAWEIKLTGAYTWEYNYISQGRRPGFFRRV